MPQIAVASFMQESNTFAPGVCTLEDFTIAVGAVAASHTFGTNSEMAGILDELRACGVDAHPLMFAWAMPSGPVHDRAYEHLLQLLLEGLSGARWDAVVLSLHGAMATTAEPDADGATIAAVREAVGDVPLIVSLDLHANVTNAMVEHANAVVGYHTDPHIDQAATGRRAARLALAALAGEAAPTSRLAKRPMLIPAESMNTSTGPLGGVRARLPTHAFLDVSLFPTQPWLDVPELGFGVVVTSDGDEAAATAAAERIADEVYDLREEFSVALVSPEESIEKARATSDRPLIVAQSADAPTAGAAGDDPTMIHTLLEHGPDLSALVPIVDPGAVAVAHRAGRGATVDVSVGCALDQRWTRPAQIHATVSFVGHGPYELRGASYTGMKVSMGRFAVLSVGKLQILVTERPSWSADPASFRHAGLDPEGVDLLLVRSCSDFRPNYQTSSRAVTLDVPGPATPNLRALAFERAPRPLWPIDA